MKSFLRLRKITSLGAVLVVSSILVAAPEETQASVVQLYNSDTVNTFISLDKLNFITESPLYEAIVNLGVDNALTAGDTVSESFSMISTSSALGITNSFALTEDYRVTLTLNGSISGVSGTGITLNSDNVYSGGLDSVSGLASTLFDVNFGSATISFSNVDTGVTVASLTLLSGGVSDVSLVAGQLLNTTTVNAMIDTSSLPFTAVGDTYLLDEFGNSLIGKLVGTITTGSTRIQTVAQAQTFTGLTTIAPIYGDSSTHIMHVGFFDNGLASTFEINVVPEPGSLALIALGLIGLGSVRRLKN